jgi:glycosyltransferase involved in cell wall biosynthesis
MDFLNSVIVPARNADATLSKTLNSLLSQTESNWEAIVIDDRSTDMARQSGKEPRGNLD